MTAAPDRAGPVAVSIDGWGHMPFPPSSMSPASVADVVRAHTIGQPPRRTPGRIPPPRCQLDNDHESTLPAAVIEVSADLDAGYYSAGVAARWRAHTELAEIPSLVDDVEDRIEQLLRRTLNLMDDPEVTERRARAADEGLRVDRPFRAGA
ncbi:hypothetical protein QMK17_03980 [Rhodococcus sp. G-MC3]|uniref:hypothetical protein n=1 Tax=Rhodococcus sp. G-MC3 TaxID=3046209 RepID=UPI0024BB2335|nr:hypothetical protein [Rhodococcus sp. G-MC3]MDJ0392492.1 hypothetical protein [Rhodococcus sp. G-MC3]